MRKRRLSKWDVAGVSLALLLFAGIVGFRAYLAGTLFPLHCKYHPTIPMPRVWISGDISEIGYSYERVVSRVKFLHGYASLCQTAFKHDQWKFYLYCPVEAKQEGLCN